MDRISLQFKKKFFLRPQPHRIVFEYLKEIYSNTLNIIKVPET